MMYWKLAIQNIRRSLRDYIIYFVTLTLTAALMYSFLALGFSSDVLAMAENMSMLTTGILLMSALVAFMSSFVIGYAIRFMLRPYGTALLHWFALRFSFYRRSALCNESPPKEKSLPPFLQASGC